MESKLHEWIREMWNQKRNIANQERKTSDQTLTQLQDFQNVRSVQKIGYTGDKSSWAAVKAILDRSFFPQVQTITVQQQKKIDKIVKLRSAVLASQDDDTYRFALKVLLETADYDTFLTHVRDRQPKRSKQKLLTMSNITDVRNKETMGDLLACEKFYVFHAIRGHVTTGVELPQEVFEICRALDTNDNVLHRVLIMFAIYGPPPRNEAQKEKRLSERQRLELLMRLRHYYDPIPTNSSIFVDEYKCTILCRPETLLKISVSTCRDPEEFRYVVQMLLQPRPL